MPPSILNADSLTVAEAIEEIGMHMSGAEVNVSKDPTLTSRIARTRYLAYLLPRKDSPP